MPLTLYGLTRCDTCRKARNWLDRHEVAYEFIDYREHPVDAAKLSEWARQAGGWDQLVNRASTTWRNLPAARKAPGSDPEWRLLFREYPTLVRRPVLVHEDGTMRQGFSDKLYGDLA